MFKRNHKGLVLSQKCLGAWFLSGICPDLHVPRSWRGQYVLVCREQERARGFEFSRCISCRLLSLVFTKARPLLNLIHVSSFCTAWRKIWYSIVPYVMNAYSSFVVEVSGLCSSSIFFFTSVSHDMSWYMRLWLPWWLQYTSEGRICPKEYLFSLSNMVWCKCISCQWLP